MSQQGNTQVPAQRYQQYRYKQSHTNPPDDYCGPASLQNWCDVLWKAVMGCLILTVFLVAAMMIRYMYEIYRAETWP